MGKQVKLNKTIGRRTKFVKNHGQNRITFVKETTQLVDVNEGEIFTLATPMTKTKRFI